MDKVIDDLLYENSKKAEDIMLEQLPLDENLNHTFSEKFKKKMDKLIKKEKRNPFVKKVILYSKKVAIVFLVVCIGCFTVTMSVDALRDKFFKKIIEIYEDFTSIHLSKNDDTINNSCTFSEPQYIPDGFKIKERINKNNGLCIVYQNSNTDKIRFQFNLVDENSIIIDTEDSNLEEITINGNTFQYIAKENFQQLVWYNNNFLNIIDIQTSNNISNNSSKINKLDILKIAKSIK